MALAMKSPKDFCDKRFLRRLTWATTWGEGLDGFDIGLISVVLVPLSKELGTSPVGVLAGLIGASSLIGIFFGAPIGGWLTDRFGRKQLFLIDIWLFVVFGVLQAFVSEWWQLFVLRLLLGIAIGAEYSIGSSMLAEFVPARGRGRRVSYMIVFWYGGSLVSVGAAYGLLDLGWSWRETLATSAIPALVVLVLRIGLPESPRWLMRHGRVDEANAIIDRYLGGDAHRAEANYGSDTKTGTDWRQLFAQGMRSRTSFASIFFICAVTPYFALAAYDPLEFGQWNAIFLSSFAFIGAIFGMRTIERIGRRKQVIGPFWVMAVALLVVGLWAGAPPKVLIAAIAVFAFCAALTGNLTVVYPVEVFPTDVRATGVGVATAFSRVGAAAGTFLFPVGITHIGLTWCMVILATMCVIGAGVSQLFAPETTGKSLSETGVDPLRPPE